MTQYYKNSVAHLCAKGTSTCVRVPTQCMYTDNGVVLLVIYDGCTDISKEQAK